MLYWLSSFSDSVSVFRIFRYLTVRTGGATVTALIFVLRSRQQQRELARA